MEKTVAIWAIVLGMAAIASVIGTTQYLRNSMMETVIVCTTTSLYETGLLDVVEDRFEAKHGIDVNFVSVGTGIAIQRAKRGDADMILVHSPSQELEFLTEGYGVNRKIIGYNFFAIVGPESDPANIEGEGPLEALSKIVENGKNGRALWVSRGDNSGTHSKERNLWTEAGLDWHELGAESWYISVGSGMGETLKKADFFSAYTLADMGSYLKYYREGLIKLKVLVDQGKELINVYSGLIVNQTRHPHVNAEGAMSFLKFLISEEGQRIFQEYGRESFGQNLFYPAVELLERNADSSTARWIRDYAFFNGTECPPEYRSGYPELYDE